MAMTISAWAKNSVATSLDQPPPIPIVPSDRAVAVARVWAAHRRGRVSFAIVDSHGRARGQVSARTYPADSVIKAMLLVAYLEERGARPVSPHDRQVLAPMIRRSSNSAARRLYRHLGRAPVLCADDAAGALGGHLGEALGMAEVTQVPGIAQRPGACGATAAPWIGNSGGHRGNLS